MAHESALEKLVNEKEDRKERESILQVNTERSERSHGAILQLEAEETGEAESRREQEEVTATEKRRRLRPRIMHLVSDPVFFLQACDVHRANSGAPERQAGPSAHQNTSGIRFGGDD